MNLRSVDLNLLTILDALLAEAHVSRAADRIGLSQPAASSALERCRYLFNDRLLERSGAGMRLTPKAQALQAPLREALNAVRKVVEPTKNALETIEQTVRLVMADEPAASLVGLLQRKLMWSAPGITLVIEPWRGAADALERLTRGELDLAASVFPVLDATMRSRLLLKEHYTVAMRADHPAAADFDLDGWLAYPHLLVSSGGLVRGALDDVLDTMGKKRRIGLVVPSFLMAPAALLESDLISMLPSRCISADASHRFACFAPPVDVPGFSLHLAWHERRDTDLAVQHVAGLIEKCF